ncbi:MAG: hypothetical protein AAB897_01705 [Patescibacteria group bacterium]|mgnify:CR=1 FL=1
MAHKERLIILIAVLILLAGFAYWFFVLRGVSPVIETPVGEFDGPASLGAQLAEEAQNPLKNALPAVAPDVNPIEGLYKNPFE